MRRKRVILAVCVVLVLTCSGLLFPFVQRVREAAARSRCENNSRQIALAHYNLADTLGSYAGTIPFSGLPPERRLSWLVALLPYVESGPYYIRFAVSAPADDERNRTAADFRYRWYVCPGSGEYDESTGGWRSPTPLTHYIGVAGVGANAAELSEGHPRAGAFGYDRKATLDHRTFVDGTANTLLILETGHNPGHWAFGGPATVRPLVPDTAPYIGPGRPFGGFHARRELLAGPHGGVMVAVVADGSVRIIRGDIDPAVLEALATVNGQEALPADW